MEDKMRIDKWLWTVRIFKTRTQAAEACEKDKVSIEGQPVKASRLVKAGTIIALRNGAFTQQYEVLQLTANRLNAKLVMEYCRNITAEDVLNNIQKQAAQTRLLQQRGEGRPTKRDRRALDDLMNR